MNLAAKPDKALEAKRKQPFAVEADFGLGRIEDLEDLRLVGLGVGVDLLAGERRTRGVASGGIANQSGAVADEENGGVAHVLEVLELAHDDRVAEVKIGRGGVHAELDAQRPAGLVRLLETLAEVGFADDFNRALAQILQLFFNGTESHIARLYERLQAGCGKPGFGSMLLYSAPEILARLSEMYRVFINTCTSHFSVDGVFDEPECFGLFFLPPNGICGHPNS